MGRKVEEKSKRQQLREERLRRQQRQRITTLLIVIGAVLIIVALLIYPTLQQSLAPTGKIVQITPKARPNANFNAMGDPNAPVKIYEFSDFQCPFCKRFSDQTEPLIVENYVATGKVYFEYIPYGPGGFPIGQESADAAMASYCAGEQGKFWEYHDILFANHTGENVGDYTLKRLEAFAQALGLNIDQYNQCMKEKRYQDKIDEGIAFGRQNNIGGTPSFLINGKVIEGAVPYQVFQQEIEAALAVSGGQ
ncbi:MAG: DsbA family protein [Anaerolineales bacterium]